ncbi:MAG TPA: hypothetical protein VH372_15930 [Actinospica sp.]|nr:hypothetical protein [Actinospica sp.]
MALLHRSHPGTEQDPQPRGGQSAATAAAPATGPAHARKSRDWKRTLILGGIALVLLIAAYFILSAFVPRWWSQRIGNAVSGSLTTGTLIGLCVGFVFTLVPLLVLTLALRPHTRWKLRITWLVLALILALPNLCTLSVVAGGGSGAHAGERTMDVNAPAFRGASLVGVLVAAALYAVIMFFILRRRPGSRARDRAGRSKRNRDKAGDGRGQAPRTD